MSHCTQRINDGIYRIMRRIISGFLLRRDYYSGIWFKPGPWNFFELGGKSAIISGFSSITHHDAEKRSDELATG